MADPAQALADLTEISSQIQAAAIFDEDGTVASSTFTAEAEADAFVRAARSSSRRREDVRSVGDLNQIEVATLEGSVFVIREHGRLVAATTSPEPTVGLVFYDLKSCLRTLEQEDAGAA